MKAARNFAHAPRSSALLPVAPQLSSVPQRAASLTTLCLSAGFPSGFHQVFDCCRRVGPQLSTAVRPRRSRLRAAEGGSGLLRLARGCSGWLRDWVLRLRVLRTLRLELGACRGQVSGLRTSGLGFVIFAIGFRRYSAFPLGLYLSWIAPALFRQ